MSNKMLFELINQGIILLLVAVGIYLMYLNFRTLFMPHKIGVVVSMGNETRGPTNAKECVSCYLPQKKDGTMSLPVKVMLDDGSIVMAETSPCCICIDKIGVGSRVGLTEIGSRTIAYRIGSAVVNLRKSILG